MPTFIKDFPIGRDQITDCVRKIGRDVMTSLEQRPDDDGVIRLTIVPILTGAFMFCADLTRSLVDHQRKPHENLDCRIEFVRASSRPNEKTKRSVEVDISRLPENAIRGCNVLVVDDILDSGETFKSLIPKLQELRPRSLQTAVLLDKKSQHGPEIQADFVAIEIPNKWVIGYGLDENGLYRNLPYIDFLNPRTGRPNSWPRLR